MKIDYTEFPFDPASFDNEPSDDLRYKLIRLLKSRKWFGCDPLETQFNNLYLQHRRALDKDDFEQCLELAHSMTELVSSNKSIFDVEFAISAGFRLAESYDSAHRFDSSAEILSQNLKRIGEYYGRKSKQFFECLLNVANACRNAGRYDEAENRLLEGIHHGQLLEEIDPERLSKALSSLAAMKSFTASFKQLEAWLIEAFEYSKIAFGDDSSRAAGAISNLACFYREHKKLEKAENHALTAVEICKRNEGTESLVYARATAVLGHVYSEMNRSELADKLFDKALSISNVIDGPLGDATSSIGYRWACHCFNQGRFQEALNGFLKSVENRMSFLDAGHPDVLSMRVNCGVAMWRLGNAEQAQLLLQESRRNFSKCQGEFGPAIECIDLYLAKLSSEEENSDIMPQVTLGDAARNFATINGILLPA